MRLVHSYQDNGQLESIYSISTVLPEYSYFLLKFTNPLKLCIRLINQDNLKCTPVYCQEANSFSLDQILSIMQRTLSLKAFL